MYFDVGNTVIVIIASAKVIPIDLMEKVVCPNKGTTVYTICRNAYNLIG